MMEFMCSLIFIKTLKNKFSQMIINKKRFKKILIKRRDSHRQKGKVFYEIEETITDKKDFYKKNRFSQMITSKNKCVQINS